MDEEDLPRLQVRGHEDVAPHRRRDLDEPGRVDERHPARHRQELTDRHGDLLGVAATRQQRAHLIADLEAGVLRVGA